MEEWMKTLENGSWKALEGFNNFNQGFVNLIPVGRTLVNLAHGGPQMVDETTDKTGVSYLVGNVTGVAWNIVTLRAAAPAMAASKYTYVAAFGKAITTPINQKLDAARWFMELSRSGMYTFKLWKNQQRLQQGLITQEQYDAMAEKDKQSYFISGTMWAIPGKSGLWLAAGNMVLGTILNEQKTDIALQNRKK